jgi:hypothetical protein
LRVAFSERVTAAEAESANQRIKSMIATVPSGFRLLTDLSGLESMNLEAAPFVKDLMDLCGKRGVAKIVRVIPNPRADIGWNIMSLFHYSRRIPITACETLAEAMKVLEIGTNETQ